MRKYLLEVSDLRTHFYTEAGVVKAVDGVTVNVEETKTIGLVGESGSGKSVTAQSVLRIVPKPGRIVAGSIKYDGEDLLRKTETEMRKMRGAQMAIIFQDPTTSLNPLYTVQKQLTDILATHEHITRRKATEIAEELLEKVGISEPAKRMTERLASC